MLVQARVHWEYMISRREELLDPATNEEQMDQTHQKGMEAVEEFLLEKGGCRKEWKKWHRHVLREQGLCFHW